MARPRSTPQPPTEPDGGSGGTVDDALGTKAQAPPAGTKGSPKPKDAPTQPAAAPTPPALPTERSNRAEILEEKTVLLYGPAGIGKSTLASEWAGGNVFFFDTANELNALSVLRQPITTWNQFLQYVWSLEKTNKDRDVPFVAGCVDTADVLGTQCAFKIRRDLGVTHESDAEWGKGWTKVREEFQIGLARLAAIPNFGVILVSHAKDVEVKTRTQTINKQTPTLTGGVREAVINMADLVLHIDYDDEDQRVIHTKPSPYWDAKERAEAPRLPDSIPWPLGQSGYDVLRKAWYGEEA